MAPSSAAATVRLRFLDASRGVTMLFTFLSHFGWLYFTEPEQQGWRISLVRIGMIATPSFVILSGMVLGVQYHTARAAFARMQARFLDRGLFLLLVGHVAISVALLRVEHGAFVLYSTDVIGIAMVLGALLVPKLDARSRLCCSAAIYATSWLAVYWWHPFAGDSIGRTVKELLFGSLTPTALPEQSFPIMPWFAVYLASSVLGEHLAALSRSGASRRLAAQLTCLGLAPVALMVAVKLTAAGLGLSPLMGNVTSALLRVGQKFPPGPLYLLSYGGIGILLVCGCIVVENRQWFRSGLRCAAVCGEASLFLFLAHFYLFWFGIYFLHRGGPGRGLVYFALSTSALILAAHVWQRYHGNRFLTFRYAINRERVAGFVTHMRLETVPVMWVEERGY
jgi:uncharacterized membrane protein